MRRAIPLAPAPEPAAEPEPSFRDQLLAALADPEVAAALLAIVHADAKVPARPLRAAR